jgi:hypothetical protein
MTTLTLAAADEAALFRELLKEVKILLPPQHLLPVTTSYHLYT